jgi:hypothetical protein
MQKLRHALGAVSAQVRVDQRLGLAHGLTGFGLKRSSLILWL